MLTEQAILETLKCRMWALLPTLSGAVLSVMLYFLAVGYYREALVSLSVDRFGEAARQITPIILILPAFFIFLVPTFFATAYADRFKTICPSCDQDISNNYQQLLATRCCPSCGKNIVEGGSIRSEAVYKRYLAARGLSFLKFWLWLWPGMSLLCFVWTYFDPAAFRNCAHVYWMPSLIGFTAAGWSWLRTFDYRYLLPAIVSVLLFCVGAWMYWTMR